MLFVAVVIVEERNEDKNVSTMVTESRVKLRKGDQKLNCTRRNL